MSRIDTIKELCNIAINQWLLVTDKAILKIPTDAYLRLMGITPPVLNNYDPLKGGVRKSSFYWVI